MKISETMQPKPVQQIDSRAGSQPGIAPNSTPAKQMQKGELVELSATLDKQLGGQQEELQAKRVASIKSQVMAGTYQVTSRAVAEKMLSGASGI